jgi:hypothetical protein
MPHNLSLRYRRAIQPKNETDRLDLLGLFDAALALGKAMHSKNSVSNRGLRVKPPDSTNSAATVGLIGSNYSSNSPASRRRSPILTHKSLRTAAGSTAWIADSSSCRGMSPNRSSARLPDLPFVFDRGDRNGTLSRSPTDRATCGGRLAWNR